MTEVTAKLRSARTSAQKVRLVADSIRGKPVGEALDILQFSPRKAGAILYKLLQSALANAEHNNNLDVDTLRVSTVTVDEGRAVRRLRMRARGRADRQTTQSSHITVKVAAGGV